MFVVWRSFCLVFTHGGLHLNVVAMREEVTERERERTRHKDNDVGVKRDVNEVRGEVLKHKGHLCCRGAPKWSVLIVHPG